MVAQIMLRTYKVKNIFSEKKNGFFDSFDLTKCLQQIEIPNFLHMSALFGYRNMWYNMNDTARMWDLLIGVESVL